MKRILCVAVLSTVVSSFASANTQLTARNQSADPTNGSSDDFNQHIIYQGQNYKKLRLDQEKYTELFQNTPQNVEGKLSAVEVGDKIIYTFSSLRGVIESDVDQIIKDDIFADEGFDSIDKAGTEALDAPAHIAIDLEAALMSLEYGGGGSELPPIEPPPIEPGPILYSAEGERAMKGICGTTWDNKRRVVNEQLTPQSLYNESVSNGRFTGNLDLNLNANGSLNVEINYKLKKRRCLGVYYKVRYINSKIKATSTFDGSSVGIRGTANYKYSEKILDNDLKLDILDFKKSWYIYFFEISLKANVFAAFNASLEADLSATIDVTQPLRGNLDIDWTCTASSCERHRNIIDYDFSGPSERNFEAVADITLRPYVKLVSAVNVDMFWGGTDVADASLGVVGSLPIRYFGYYGNMCSDADGDGSNETISASVLDVTGEIFLFYKYDVLGKSDEDTIPFSLSGWKKLPQDSQTLSFCGPWMKDIFKSCSGKDVYQKPIYFKDYENGSEVFEPVLVASSTLPQNFASINVKARQCYPFYDDLELQIDWGEGGTEKHIISDEGEDLTHTFAFRGPKQIKARFTGDVAGRDFNSGWTEITRTVVAGSGDTGGGEPAPDAPALYKRNLYDSNGRVSAVEVYWDTPSSGTPDQYRYSVDPSSGAIVNGTLPGTARWFLVTLANYEPLDTIEFKLSACNANNACSAEPSSINFMVPFRDILF